MRRVLVIGCAGAGKSTFSQSLADKTGLSLIHLDQHFWRPNWIELDKNLWTVKIDQLVSKPDWIMDGNYGGTLPLRLKHADTVIFLDLSPTLCLWRVIKRTLQNYGRTRADMTEGCRERFDRAFIKYIWNFPRDHRPNLMKRLHHFHGNKIILKNQKEVCRYLGRLPGTGGIRHKSVLNLHLRP